MKKTSQKKRPNVLQAIVPQRRHQVRGPAGEESFARIVVEVPEMLHRQLKATAAIEGKSIHEYILEMLAENGVL